MQNRDSNLWGKSLEVGLSILLAVMLGLVFLNVILRYVFNSALTWSDEVARFLFVWLTFMGAALALRRKAHLGMDAVVESLPYRYRRWAAIVSEVVIMSFLLIVIYGGTKILAIANTYLAPSTQIPMSWVYVILPISSVLMLFQVISDLLRIIRTGEVLPK